MTVNGDHPEMMPAQEQAPAQVFYLAHPIDFADQESLNANLIVMQAVKSHLAVRGVGWFDPMDGFGVGHCDGAPTRIVAATNHIALTHSNGMIAVLSGGAPSLGTGIEIERALHNGIPVLVVGGSGWSLAGFEHRPNFRAVTDQDMVDFVIGLDWLCDFEHTMMDRRQVLPWAATGEGGEQPLRHYEDDAGLDLVVAEDTEVPPGEFVDVPNRIAIELPSHTWGMITGRSSTLRKRGLMVAAGVIDPGYRGELYSGVWNLTSEVVDIAQGERIAQLILLSNITRVYEPMQVPQLEGSPRADNGFGSTGR